MLSQRSTQRLANLMTIFSTLFYLMNMVVAELLFDHISIAVFVTLKHILPYLVNIAVPVLVLVTQDDIRKFFAAKTKSDGKNRQATVIPKFCK